MTFVTVHAGHLYVISRHQLFDALSFFHRIRGGVKSYVVAMLVSWSIPSSLSQPRPLDVFRVDRMSFQSFLSLQVSTQVPGELLTEVGQMCKSRVESCHVFDWLEYFLAGKAGKHDVFGSFARYQLHQWRPSSKVNVWMVPMEVSFYFPGRKGRDLHS